MSRAPWHAEHSLDSDAMARALERRFPEFEVPEVEVLQPGWDYFAYRVDQDWVFKVPKRADVVSRMRQEVSLLTALPTMGASIPRPTFHGVAAKDVPVPFFGYPRLDGVFALEADPTSVIPQVLDFIETLHTILPPFAVELPREAPWDRRAQALEALLDDHPDLRTGWAWMRDHPPTDAPAPVLLHADLGPEHILLDTDGQLHAVIDWADAIRGDPARDLVALLLWDPAATAASHSARGGDPHELQRAYAYALQAGLEILRDFDRWGSRAVEEHLIALRALQGLT